MLLSILIGSLVSCIINFFIRNTEQHFIAKAGCVKTREEIGCPCCGDYRHCEQECFFMASQGNEKAQKCIDSIGVAQMLVSKFVAIALTAVCITVCYLIIGG